MSPAIHVLHMAMRGSLLSQGNSLHLHLPMARATAPDSFGEHVGVMKALYQEYQKHEDINSINTVDSIIKEMQTYCQQQDMVVKEIIKGLSKDVTDLKAASTYPHPEGSHGRKVAAAEADIRDMKQGIDTLSASTRDADTQRQHLIERSAAAATQAKEVAKQQQLEEDTLRQQLGLYAHISKICWRLDKDKEARIAGTISNPHTAHLITFDEDPNSAPQFDLVNKLWQLSGN